MPKDLKDSLNQPLLLNQVGLFFDEKVAPKSSKRAELENLYNEEKSSIFKVVQGKFRKALSKLSENDLKEIHKELFDETFKAKGKSTSPIYPVVEEYYLELLKNQNKQNTPPLQNKN